jgi:hypothetical protein
MKRLGVVAWREEANERSFVDRGRWRPPLLLATEGTVQSLEQARRKTKKKKKKKSGSM